MNKKVIKKKKCAHFWVIWGGWQNLTGNLYNGVWRVDLVICPNCGEKKKV